MNLHDLAPNQIVAGPWVCLETAEVWVQAGRLSLSHSLLHRSPSFPYVEFTALAGNPVDNAILFSCVVAVYWSHKV